MTEETPIRFKTIIEVLGKPKDHVENTIKMLIERIEKESGLSVLNKDFADSKEQENGFWSTFCEMEAVAKDFALLFGFCIDFMPSSVEIMKPESMHFSSKDMTDMLTDLQGKLHTIDMVAKQLRNENDFLKKNMNTMIKNTLILLLRLGIKDLNNLSKTSGIPDKELEKFLENMIQQGTIKKEGEEYILQNEQSKA